ncbi:hypothetical protein [Spirosoma oryzicola]|uniref:hypothetical protein n=1 Tax=Spirosoma oryzicola TaxID=2898794 RepID=UPI001E305A71|nr:hypothetical protein [Spirosoma oryzicola]UHG89322.1 hypothetical protein LQ777_13820 [Spirosoma oryzicola]
MKTAIKAPVTLFVSFALLSACSNPQSDITPATSSQPASSVNAQTAAVAKPGLLIQTTEYYPNTTGGKTVMLNGKEIRLGGGLKNEYGYDTQKRLTQEKTTNATWWKQLSYEYTPDLVQRYLDSDRKDYLNTLLLNTSGFLKGNQEAGEYVYDSEGYLIRYTGNGQQDTYTIKNGNVVAKETVYNSGLVQKNTYEYDLTKPSIPSPLTFRGKQTQNLVTKQTMVSTTGNVAASEMTVFSFYYDFDQQGRAIREFIVSSIDPSSPSKVRELVYQ